MAGWTDEEDEILKKGLIDNETYGAIAKKLPGRNRMGCIGRARRKGYALLGSGQAAKASPGKRQLKPRRKAGKRDLTPKAPKQTVVCDNQFYQRRLWRMANKTSPDRDVGSEIKSPAPVALLDHQEHQCRWPLGDPRTAEFRFCGNKKVGHEHYCDGHAAEAHISVRRRCISPDRRDTRPQGSPALQGCF